MVVIRIDIATTHKSNDWQPGDQPTVKTSVGAQLITEGKATFIKFGCGCNASK